jgi:hypothetical protein
MFIHGSGQNEQPLYRGPFIDASYQVSVHLAKGFQRRRLKCEKLTEYVKREKRGGVHIKITGMQDSNQGRQK